MKKFEEMTQNELKEMYDDFVERTKNIVTVGVEKSQIPTTVEEVKEVMNDWKFKFMGEKNYFFDIEGLEIVHKEGYEEWVVWIIDHKPTFYKELYKQTVLMLDEKKGSAECDWNDSNQLKYSRYYDFEDETLETQESNYFKAIGAIYSTSKETIELAYDFINSLDENAFEKYVEEVKV